MKKKINNPDVTNESLAYWEKVLASHGLGINQPLTDNSNDETVQSPHIPRNSSHTQRQNDLSHLRTVVDGDDRFMNAHEIKKVRGAYDDRKVPLWTQNDVQMRRVLLTAFPKLQTSAKQRLRAVRWVKFIYAYYRLMLPRPVIMKEMGMTDNAMKMLVRTLNKVSKGLTRHGGTRKGHHPPSL